MELIGTALLVGVIWHWMDKLQHPERDDKNKEE